MAGIISVERFSITLAAGTASNSATLTKGQTVANCVPFHTTRVTTVAAPVDNASQVNVDVSFSGSTVVAATSDGATRALVVEVTVVEFDATKVTVQQGTYQIATASTSTTAAPTAVVLANTFLYHSWQVDGAQATTDPAAVRGRITSTTQLTFDRGASGGVVDGHWYLVESDTGDFSVEALSITLTGAASNTGTVSAVTLAKAFVIGSHYATSAADDNTLGSVEVRLTSTTQVTVQRNGATGNIEWAGFVIEFAGGGAESVQRGNIAAQGATASQSIDITAVDLDLAMVISPGLSGSWKTGSFPGGGSSDNCDPRCAWDFVDTDTIRVQHTTSGGEANNDIAWEVVVWEIQTASLEQEGFRFYADGTESGSTAKAAQDVDIIDQGQEDTFQLRVLLNATGDPATAQYQLEYKETSDGASEWRKVPT